MTKAISILGSTGSIGRQTLDVADDLGLRVAALSANRDVDRMEAQCRKYRPELAVLIGRIRRKGIKSPPCGYNYTGGLRDGGSA